MSSSGYPASPSVVITLDSPSPPRTPPNDQHMQQNQPPSCMMASTNGNSNQSTSSLFGPGGSMPFLDLDNEASSANMNYPTGY